MPRKKKYETVVVFTKMNLDDAWNRCNMVSALLGLVADRSNPKQELYFDLSRERPGLYWVGVVLGLFLYVLPGLYMLWYYRTIELTVRFSATPAGTLMAGEATWKAKEAWLVFDQFRRCLADNLMTVELTHPYAIRSEWVSPRRVR